MNATTLPLVSPMTIRKITPISTPGREPGMLGGVIVMYEYEVEPAGEATARLDFDEDVVDCSNRIFELTNMIIASQLKESLSLTVFPSRRWRNHRTGMEITSIPSAEAPLLYLGNPVRILYDPAGGITVFRLPEFTIKSGCQLGY